MSPRKAAASSNSQRTQLRASELTTPEASARNINEIFRELQQRLEAVERVLFVDVSITPSGNAATAVVGVPSWPVRGVYLARAWDSALSVPAFPRLGNRVVPDGLELSLYLGDVSVGTRYDLTVELRG